MNKPSHYRPDIDGLRALAIIPVLLYHYGVSGFSGGFVGVDIFFVISGYLITAIILRELRTGHFSFAKFWERRFRRIAPALFVMLMVTTFVSYFVILFPTDFKDYGASLSAQSVFLANLWFMRTDDYFAAPSETIPLLHTWSLAVEEQFYIIFPLILWLLYRYARKYINHLLTASLVASLAYCVYLVNIDPSARFTLPFLPHLWGGATNLAAGFYFTAPRAFELLIGVLLATTNFRFRSPLVANAAAWIGLIAIIYAVVTINTSTPFPGLMALLPTLGTALLIVSHTNHQTFLSNLLSFPIFVGVGLISYALYLWHWPVLVLAKYWTGGVLGNAWVVGLLVMSFMLAIGSYYLVETPFRTKRLLPQTKQMIVGGFLMLAISFGCGFIIVSKQGFPQRAPEAAQKIAQAAVDFNPRRSECFTRTIADLTRGKPACLLGTQDPDRIDFVLWGDSHSDALMLAFDAYGKETNTSGIYFGIGGCAPLVTAEAITKDENCQKEKDHALSYINSHQPKNIFLVTSWQPTYTEVSDEKVLSLTEALEMTLSSLPAKSQIVTLLPGPVFDKNNVRSDFIAASKTGAIDDVKMSLKQYQEQRSVVEKELEYLSFRYKNFHVLDPAATLCNDGFCYLYKDGQPLYRDGSHLTQTSSLTYIRPLLDFAPTTTAE